MGYPNGQVDIPGLAKIGGNVTHSADAFDKAFSAQADVLAPGSTLTGWATGAALPGVTDAWSTFVKTLAGQVRSFGVDLTKASNEYQATDDAAADRVSRAGVSGQAPQ